MFKVNMVYNRLGVDVAKLNATMLEETQIQVRQAAREFLRAMIDKIPVLTGEARGTLLPLGKFLRVQVPIPGAAPISGNHSHEAKSAETGSQPDKQLLFNFNNGGKGKIYFQVDKPQLFHYWLNEFHFMDYPHGQLPTPWKSFDAGGEAFNQYIKTYYVARIKNRVKVQSFIILEEEKLQ